jgi:peptidoglycan/LPS O-acetylase OafA/YrhL
MRHRITRALVLSGSPTVKAAFSAVHNRGPGFDTIRLLAACTVVFHHSRRIEHDILHDGFFRFTGGYLQLGLLAVSVFFCLSGFLVTPGLAKTGNVIEYLSRRFMRIMPLLAFGVVATALVIGPLFSELAPGDYYSRKLTWYYLKNITTSLSLQLPGVVDYDGGRTINGPMWTLRYEWLCYFLIAATSLLGMFRRRTIFLLVWLAALAVVPLVWGPLPEGHRPPLFTLLLLFSYFGAGVLIYLYADVLRWSRVLMALAAVLLVASWRSEAAYIVAPGLTAYIVIGFGLLRMPWTGLLEKADLSYGVYLTHSVVLMVLMNLFHFTSWIALFATALPLACFAALFTWTFIEKPALRRKSLPADLVRRALGRARPRQVEAAAE